MTEETTTTNDQQAEENQQADKGVPGNASDVRGNDGRVRGDYRVTGEGSNG